MRIYEGNENYIFVSYAHKDSGSVLPIVDQLSAGGFRLWYDSGIEAGTEWPENIEDHLNRASVVLVFMTPAAVESRNCRNEINYALELQKEILVVYMEDTQLLKGMRLQLNSTQSLFRQNHRTQETFLRELMDARILQGCRDGFFENNKSEYKKNVGVKLSDTRIGNVCAIGTNDEYDIWPKGTYAQKFNRDEFSVVFFHITTIRPFGFAGTIPTHYQVYNSRNDLIYDHEGTLQIQPDYDKISTGWILKGKDGTFVPSGDYTFVCSLNNSPDFSYPFTVVSDEEVKSSSFFGKLKSLFL